MRFLATILLLLTGLIGFTQPNSGFLVLNGDSSAVLSSDSLAKESDKTLEFLFETCAGSGAINAIAIVDLPKDSLSILMSINSNGTLANLTVKKTGANSFMDTYPINIYRHNAWHHFAMTFSKADSNLSLYFNGDLLGISDSASFSSNQLIIGGQNTFLKANIDDLHFADSLLYTSAYSTPKNIQKQNASIFLFSFNNEGGKQRFLSSGRVVNDSLFTGGSCAGSDGYWHSKDTSFCKNDTILLMASGGTHYKWTAKGFIDDDTSNTIRYFSPSRDTVQVTISNANGCFVNRTIHTIPDGYPEPKLGKDTTLCFGDALVLKAGNQYTSYKWSDGSTDSLVYAISGINWVTVKNATGCIGTDTILVQHHPQINLDLGKDTLLPDGYSLQLFTKKKYKTYEWSTGETTDTILATLPLIYSVTVTDENGCVATDDITINFRPASIDETSPEDQFMVYPNPIRSDFTILVPSLFKGKILDVKLIQASGAAVLSRSFETHSIASSIHVKTPKGLPNGVYFLRVSSEGLPHQMIPVILLQ